MKTHVRLDFGSTWFVFEGRDGDGYLTTNLRDDTEPDDYARGGADALESLLLALFCAGVDVSTQAVHDAIATALDAIDNNS